MSGGCEAGQVCKQGECVCQPDCSDKACGGDDGCGGTCLSGSCPGNGRCFRGQCSCVPSCRNKACGADDGCGNRCRSGTCASANEFCSNGQCVCTLAYHKQLCRNKQLRCGDYEDTCGRRCVVGTCAGGKTCQDGQCVCTRSMVDDKCRAKGLACGAIEPDCGMKCYVGSCSGSNEFCERGVCKCNAYQGCQGKRCGEYVDGCASRVRCSGSCESGYTCRSYRCQCTASTVAAKCEQKELACGATEPECGMRCSVGRCNGSNEFCQSGRCTCNVAEACRGKRCGEYAEGCPGVRCRGCDNGYSCNTRTWRCECSYSQRQANCRNAACGASDGCGGTCSSGYCQSPQEQCRNGRCVCIPQCDSCGGSDGCGGTCLSGSCPGDEFCEQGVCKLTCGCGQKVDNHRCVDICGPTESLCGCNSCCSAGEVCLDRSRGLCGTPGPD
jgi:hypothetical protein